MDFGLGLVLSFTDNASSGINNAVNSLNHLTEVAENAGSSLNQMASLSALSVVTDQMGDSFLKAGRGIMGLFQNLLGNVQSTGSEFENFRITLNALYGDSQEAEKQISKLLDFSVKSPFEVSDVKDMLIVLKSQGIDAFEQMSNASNTFRQENLSWIADLMAFKPDIPAERWRLAITNYLGSGEAKMLRNALDMGNIPDLLGHSIGSTAEERMQDLIQIVNDANIQGLADNMSSTWQGVASNIDDAFTKLYKSIADNGVFEKLKSSFMGVAGAIMSLDNEQLEAFGKTIADGLNLIVAPITKVAEKINLLINKFIDLCQTRPEIVKWGMVFGAVIGVLFIFVGVILKVTSAMSGLSLMLLTFGKSFKDIGTLIKTGSLKILGTLLPLATAIGLFALAWKTDFAGIKTNVTEFAKGVVTAFKTAKESVSGSVGDLVSSLNELRSKDDFFSNLTIGIMKVMMLLKSLADGWNDYELSEDNFLKAKELGILPLIETILDLKYRFEFFKQGFLEGWREIGDAINSALQGFLENVKGTALESLVNSLTEFLQKLSSGDTESWRSFGETCAYVSAGVISVVLAFKMFSVVASIVSSVVKVVSTLWGLITKVAGVLKSVVSFIINNPITMVITGIATALASFVDMFINGFSWIKEAIMVVGIALAVVGAILLGVAAFPAVVVGAIVAAVATLIIVIKDHWNEIKTFFGNVLSAIGGFFSNLWNGIVKGVTKVVNAIKNFFGTIANWIYTNVIAPVVNFFTNIVFPIVLKIIEIVMKVNEIITTLIIVFVQWIKNNVIDPIINFFVGLWNMIVSGVVSFVQSVQSVIGTIVGWINTNIITPISTFFTGLWNNIVSSVTSFIQGVKSVFITIVNWIKTNIIDPISNFFSNLWSDIETAFNVVADTISSVLKGAVNMVLNFICGVINSVISGLNGAINVINEIPGVSITKIDKLEVPQLARGGIVDQPTLSVIGEAGKEAVMPLENNTEWIGSLASMLSGYLNNDITPTGSSNYNTTNNQGDTNRYLTSNNTSNNTYEGDTDNSVVFNEGAIQITVQNATEEEAIKFAKVVMEYIKRQKELDKMLHYA